MPCRVLWNKFYTTTRSATRSRHFEPAGLLNLSSHCLAAVDTRLYTVGRLADFPLSLEQATEKVSLDKVVLDGDDHDLLVEAKAGAVPPPLDGIKLPNVKARIWEDDDHLIQRSDVPKAAWNILLRLKLAGHEGYVVGGAIRDLLLGRQPKDFDILTSATVNQVRKLLHSYGARAIGKRFPIVVVNIGKAQMEVSSFATNIQAWKLPPDASALQLALRNILQQERTLPAQSASSEMTWATARRQNAQTRDFTVNALLYDPFASVIYDYTGGVADCRRRLLRTIVEADLSFAYDPARMLRAIRHAARAGLRLEAKTCTALRRNAMLLQQIPSSRLTVEVHALMAYGSAQQSVQLLWQYGMLAHVLPELSDFMVELKISRKVVRERAWHASKAAALFDMLARLDRQAAPGRPIPATVWQVCMIDFVVMHIRSQPSSVSKTIRSGGTKGLPCEDGALVMTPDQRKDYLSQAGIALGYMIDRPAAKLITKAARQPIQDLIRQQLDKRLGSHQKIVLVCRGCQHAETVDASKKTPKCPACGRSMPTKALRGLRSPELMAIVDVLQPGQI